VGRRKKKRELDKIIDQAKKLAIDLMIKTEDFEVEAAGGNVSSKLTRG